MDVEADIQRWPIRGTFRISRGAKTEAEVVVATVRRGDLTGRGECVPYARYGETVEGVAAAIRAAGPLLSDGRHGLLSSMPAGAARNALDCALWDLEAKMTGRRVAEAIGVDARQTLLTAFTLSVDAPEAMARAAEDASDRPILKLKFAGDGDRERIAAVRAARPDAQLIVDANEAWTEADFADNMAACAAAGVALLEQPLPAGNDALLARVPHPLAVCADESVHTAEDVARLADRYDAVNIKLDKAGGLTAALLLRDAARAAGLRVMVGCMVSTSLAMAPAALLATGADVVDLDGPLLLDRDRVPGLRYRGATLDLAGSDLWG